MIGRAPLQDPTSVRRTLPPLKLTHQKQRLCCSTPQHAAEAKKLAYSLGSFILADFLPQTLSVRLQPRIFERTPLYCAPPSNWHGELQGGLLRVSDRKSQTSWVYKSNFGRLASHRCASSSVSACPPSFRTTATLLLQQACLYSCSIHTHNVNMVANTGPLERSGEVTAAGDSLHFLP